ncbi:MAG: glycosyltransferase family 4 protein [Candidatus Hadarchaeales archaeon]
MRILHINPFFYPYLGGTENYLFELCRRHSRKHDISVITSMLPGTRGTEIIEGIRVHRVKSLILKKLPAFLPPPFSIPVGFRNKLERICRGEDPDIIHLHNRFFLNFSSVAFWKDSLGKPLFLTLHNARPFGISREVDLFGQMFDDLVGARIMRRSDRIIANSRWTLEVTVPKDYPKDQTEVIYNGVDTKKFRKVKSDIKDHLGCEFLSITVCRLVEQKGVEFLIKALPSITPKMKSIIIGRGPELHKLVALSKKLGVSDRVVFITHFVEQSKLIEHYSAGDVFVLPSLWEPFGIVLIEAMACELPTVATKVGGIPEVVGDCGILVEPKNPAQMAGAVNFLLEDKNARKRLSKRTRRRAKTFFDFDVIAKQVERSYEAFLRKRR